ncbi:MAG: hypothetical protein ACLT8P_14510 [Holdemanella porci]|uniref:hypothetical protein n=1 Tax=Holdemanella porci TaxID=2652276 RepID=UPI00399335AD
MNLNDYVKFDDSCKQFEIVTGTQGKYSYDDVTRVSVLNEKAKYKGKGIPFTAVLPGGPLPSGLFQNPYLYVGIKVVLKDNSVLPIYVSKEKVLFNSDKYLNDVKEANDILKKLEKRLQS